MPEPPLSELLPDAQAPRPVSKPPSEGNPFQLLLPSPMVTRSAWVEAAKAIF